MGIVHLAGIGTSPGAVTAGLAYLKKEKPVEVAWEIVEELILFTSPEVRYGKVSAINYRWNQYGTTTFEYGRRRERENVLSVVKKFLKQEELLPQWGKMYVWTVDTNDFDSCFEAVAKVVIAKGDPQGTGKHLWANLTGGTNILNAAIMEAAILSGLISRLYYTFIHKGYEKDYEPCLQPPVKNRPDIFNFRWLPFVKVTFDEIYYGILEVLHQVGDWCPEEETLSRLKNLAATRGQELKLELHQFKTQYLNHMDGREIERKDFENRLSPFGEKMLNWLKDPLYRALIRREEIPFYELIDQCRQELKEKEWQL